MPKPEWGVKRTCPHCETRFYDLQKEPIVCPECGTTYDVDSYGKVSAARERRTAVPVGADREELVDEEDVAADEEGDEDGDAALLGDEEDDEDEKSTGPALSDEDEEGEDDAFKDTGIIDDDEEDEDDVGLDDNDDDIDLDEIPDDDKR